PCFSYAAKSHQKWPFCKEKMGVGEFFWAVPNASNGQGNCDLDKRPGRLTTCARTKLAHDLQISWNGAPHEQQMPALLPRHSGRRLFRHARLRAEHGQDRRAQQL